MNKNLLKLLFAILIFSSCTVHKRLHQPGWDINFRGNWKMNHEKQIATNLDTLSIHKIDFQVDQKQSIIKNHSERANPVICNVLTESDQIEIHEKHRLNQTTQPLKLVAKQSNKNVFKKIKQLKNNTDTREARVIAWAFILIGLLILIIGLLIYFSGDVTIVGSFISIVGIIGMAVGSVFLLMGLILLLTLLITNGVVKNEQRLKQQAKEAEKSPLEESSENENQEETTKTPIEEEPLPKEKTETKSKNWLIVGGAVLVLSVLFLVLKAN